MPYHAQPEDLLITLWHGANRKWDGFPEVQPCRPKAYEHGPGLYLTTHLETAEKYAKGGGSVVAMTLRNPRLLDDQRIPLADAVAFVNGCPGLRKRKDIVADLNRVEARRGDSLVGLNNVVTLCVNHEALSGASGLELAAWLVTQGVDAQVVSASGQEDWLVVFNPSIIVESRKVSVSSIDVASADHPRVLHQLDVARLKAERAVLVELARQVAPEAQPLPRVRL